MRAFLAAGSLAIVMYLVVMVWISQVEIQATGSRGKIQSTLNSTIKTVNPQQTIDILSIQPANERGK